MRRAVSKEVAAGGRFSVFPDSITCDTISRADGKAAAIQVSVIFHRISSYIATSLYSSLQQASRLEHTTLQFLVSKFTK